MIPIVTDFNHSATHDFAQSHVSAFSSAKIADSLIASANVAALTARMRAFAEVRFCIAEASGEAVGRAA